MSPTTPCCSPLINKALEFSAQVHLKQIRKGTDIPYITHPYAVGMILARSGCPESIVIAGILHDTVEDTEATLDGIRSMFGEDVAVIVAGCSEPDKGLSWEKRKQHTIDELRHAPIGVQLVACADKLHNISSMIDDHSRVGNDLWDRFNRGKVQQQWYYRGLVKSLEYSEVGNHELFKELRQAVMSFFGNQD